MAVNQRRGRSVVLVDNEEIGEAALLCRLDNPLDAELAAWAILATLEDIQQLLDERQRRFHLQRGARLRHGRPGRRHTARTPRIFGLVVIRIFGGRPSK